jgi:outer membrane protein TolC
MTLISKIEQEVRSKLHNYARNTLFVVFMFTLFMPTWAQVPEFVKVFSLEDAVQYALKNNFDAKNSSLDLDKARWRNWEIKSIGLPSVSANADYTYYFKLPIVPAAEQIFNNPNQPSTKIFSYLAQSDPVIQQILYNSAIESKEAQITFVLPHNFTSGITVSQLIFDGRYIIGLKATRDFTKIARLQKDLSDREVRYNVMKAYYQAQSTQESVNYLQEVKKLLEKITNDTRKIYNEGLIEELDVNRLELALSNLEGQLKTTEKLAQVAMANLKFQMGLNLTDEIILTDKISDLRAKIDPTTAENFDASKRAEYQLLEVTTRVRNYDVQQRRSGHFPTLVGFLNYGWQAQVNDFRDFFSKREVTYPDGEVIRKSRWFEAGIVGLKLNIPIFDSGNKLANVQQGKIDELKHKNDFEKFKQASALQFASAQAFFIQALNEELFTKKSVELSEKIFYKTRVKFTEGLGSSFEMVQAQQELIQNKIKFIQAQLNLLNTKADLDKAAGK